MSKDGIQLHSTMSAGDSYIIFATNHPDKALESMATPCKGSYKGELENSWIINADHYHFLKLYGYITDQESVLVIGPWEGNVEGHRPATLHFVNPKLGDVLPINLGYFTEVSEEEARKQDAWTLKDGKYWICKHMRPHTPK